MKKTKRCSGCGKVKDRIDFYKKGGSTAGVLSECKDCTKKRTAQTQKNHQMGVGTRIPGPKVCCGCGVLREVEDFDKDSRTADGLVQRCKTCVKDRSSRHYVENQEELLAQGKVWRQTHLERARDIGSKWYADNREEQLEKSKAYLTTLKGKYVTAKKNAKQRNRLFTLTEEVFYSIIQKSCFVTGCTDKVTGLDRIDNNQGYTNENVRPCCNYHNIGRNDQTDAEYYLKCKTFVQWYENIRAKS